MKKYVVILLSALLTLGLFVFAAQAASLPDEEEPTVVTLTREEFADAERPAPSGARNAVALPAALRSAIGEAVMNCDASVNALTYHLTWSDSLKQQIADLVFYSTPEYFNVASLGYSISSNELSAINFTYHYDAARFEEMMDGIEAATSELLSGVKGNTALGEVEKALLIHDRLALRCEYDPVALRTNFASKSDDNSNIYGALVSRKAVCQGYAEAYQYLLGQVGIDSFVTSSDYQISGNSVDGHAWNVVYIGGKPYHADVTWDDATNDITGRVLHNYFLISTQQMLSQRSYATDDYDFDLSPVDTTYDGKFWTCSDTAFTLLGNTIYYLNDDNGDLCRYPTQTALYTIGSGWPVHDQPGYTYVGKMARLATDGTDLFFNTDSAVIRYSVSDGSTKTVYTPSGSVKSIVGFAYEDGCFIGEYTADATYTLDTKDNDGFRYRYAEEPAAETLNAANVTLFAAGLTYNGKVQQPAVTVKNAAGKTLTKGTDYTVAYSAESKVPGSYTVTVTVQGGYTGAATKTYTIAKQPLSSARVTLSWTSKAYNGAVQKPAVTVKNASGYAMTKDSSYTLSWSADSKYPGTYTVTATGKGYYTGTVKKTYTITKQPLDASRVTLSWTSKAYNGAVQKPAVTVKNASGYAMTKDSSYTLFWSADSKYPGTYTVTATGKGYYTGTIKKTYTITKQPLDASRVTLSWTSKAYNGAVQKPAVTVKNVAGYAMTKDSSYTLSWSADSKYPGTYTVTATGKGYYSGTVKKTYTIAKQPLDASRVTLSWTSKTYNGKVQQPTVTVKNAAGYTMTKDTSYTVSYSGDCKAKGTYTVTVTGKGYYSGKVSKTFTIK